MKKDILFVTSSTKKMFDFSGKHLVESFLKNQNNTLVYYTENFDLPIEIIKNKNIKIKNIENDYNLIVWLKKFSNIIPKEFGGDYDYKKNELSVDNFMSPIKTKDWNYKASLWFRKIVALYNSTIFFKNYKYIIWLDNDCIIKKNIDENFLESLFENKKVFYFLGDKRKKMDFGVESGFLGFKNINIIKNIYNYYLTGKFLKHKRWDDGYILKYIFNNDDIYNDVAKNSYEIDVLKKIKDTLIHNKGNHWKNDIDYKGKKKLKKKENILKKEEKLKREIKLIKEINKYKELTKKMELKKEKNEMKLMKKEDMLSRFNSPNYHFHILIIKYFNEISKKKPIFKIYKEIINLLENNKLEVSNLKKFIFNYFDRNIRLKLKNEMDINKFFKRSVNDNIIMSNNLKSNYDVYKIKSNENINVNLNINNKIVKINDNYLYFDNKKIFFENRIHLIEYLLGYYPINNIPKFILERLEVFVIGKGPSLNKIIKREHKNQIIVAINNAANVCEDIDFLCINDQYNYDSIDEEILKKVKNIIMITNPHLNLVCEDKSIKQTSIKDYTYIDLYNKIIKLKCFAKIHLCSIHTSFIKKNNILDLGKVHSSGDTAITFFIKNGFKRIKTIGIGDSVGYSNLTNRIISKRKVIKTVNEKEWYSENFNAIINKLNKNKINFQIT